MSAIRIPRPPSASWSGPATRLLAARALRDFGDGFVAVLLPAYLLALGFSPLMVGVVATVSLLGSALLTIAAGLLGARHDPARLLLACAALMIATGVAFAVVHDYALLLVIAFVGTVNPSAGSVSVFVPLEHAALTRESDAAGRTRLFARYSLVGALAATSALGPSRGIVMKLAALFSLDAFAGGFVVQSLLALWLFERFGLSLTEAGVFFFWSGVLSALSFPVAAWLARRIGLVNTMVFTHIPASIALILAAFAPTLPLALSLLLVRAALSQMDVPTRSSYVMAVVTEAERAAAASFTAVPRSLAAAVSPALAGALFAASYRAWPLVICGVLRIAYDALLLEHFRHRKPPEER